MKIQNWSQKNYQSCVPLSCFGTRMRPGFLCHSPPSTVQECMLQRKYPPNPPAESVPRKVVSIWVWVELASHLVASVLPAPPITCTSTSFL